jgi:putative tryptophan/tyrosine transport system substrate-binding protein
MKGFVRMAFLAAAVAATPALAQDKVIAVATFIEHPAVQRLLDGLRAGLTDAGLTPERGYRLDLQSAQGSAVTAGQIARKFAGDRPAVIVTAGTPVTQPAVQQIKDIPIVFSGLADPIGAKVVASLERPGGNVSGVSDRAPYKPLIDLMAEIVPKAKRIGLIFNAGEANSRAQIDRFKAEAGAAGYAFVEATVAKASDTLAAAQSLVGKADVIYVPNDGTVVSNFEAVTRVSLEAKLPVFASALDSVQKGAIAATGVDYEQIGRRTAALVARVLKGENPGAIPVDLPQTLDVSLNKKVATAIGITLPSALLQRAKSVTE